MTKKESMQTPLILRANRLIDAFAKSDDERDFYLDRIEGFLIYVDLSKSGEELANLETELTQHKERYCLIPKLTFYQIKKIMEGFVNEKVYDIDTKEKVLDIVQSHDARENFLEFIYDHESELEKWQQYYQERSRIRIIEWLRSQHFDFVFEEDLGMPAFLVEKLKQSLFEPRVSKEISSARDALELKAKTYYSNEALNPRPKRGRPPKQVVKIELEPQFSRDVYMQVPPAIRPFLYVPNITSVSSVVFSSRFDTEEEFLAHLHKGPKDLDFKMESLNQRLASLSQLSQESTLGLMRSKIAGEPTEKIDMSIDDDDDDDDEISSASSRSPAARGPGRPKGSTAIPKAKPKTRSRSKKS